MKPGQQDEAFTAAAGIAGSSATAVPAVADAAPIPEVTGEVEALKPTLIPERGEQGGETSRQKRCHARLIVEADDAVALWCRCAHDAEAETAAPDATDATAS